jgi:hypothetical protein
VGRGARVGGEITFLWARDGFWAIC